MAALQPRLGVDFGRVINDADGSEDTSFLGGSHEDAMLTPAMAGVYESLERLTKLFDGNVWIVSKCGERIQERTLQWLEFNDFWAKTGIPRENARFCRKRPEKAVHCKRLGITHFIDDRRDVLGHLRGLVPNLYLFGPQKTEAPDWVRHTMTWPEVEAAVIEGIVAEPRPRARHRSR